MVLLGSVAGTVAAVAGFSFWLPMNRLAAVFVRLPSGSHRIGVSFCSCCYTLRASSRASRVRVRALSGILYALPATRTISGQFHDTKSEPYCQEGKCIFINSFSAVPASGFCVDRPGRSPVVRVWIRVQIAAARGPPSGSRYYSRVCNRAVS